MNEYLKRIAEFLSQYLEADDGGKIRPEPDMCSMGVMQLMINNVFESKEDMKLECLRSFDVMIPDYMFGEVYE